MIDDSITIELNGKKQKLSDFTAVDENMLSQEFSQQASKMAYIGHMMVEAEMAHNERKTEREILEAEIDADSRAVLEEDGVKYTEAKIRGMVVVDEERIKAVNDEADAYEAYKKLKVLADAMRIKGDMLISLGALVRAESDLTGMTIKQTLRDLKDVRS